VPLTVGLQSGVNLNRINPNFYVAPGLTLNQYASNVATLGQAASQIPPYLLGYNPYPQVANYGPSFPTIAPSPYGVSTMPGAVAPGYGGGGYGAGGYGASLATDPYGAGAYSLSTTGSPAGLSPYGYPYNSYGGYGDPTGTGGYLRGVADVTAATGKYWKDIESARLMREQSRQAAMDTQRRRMMEDAYADRMRPTAQDVRDREMNTDLNRARKDPPATEIWSGRSLNDLLRSINNAGRLSRAPSVPLEEDMLRGINLTDQSSRGNIGLLKDGGKLNWPLPLQDTSYDEARKRLSRNMVLAVQQLKDKDPLQPGTLADMRADYKAINDRLTSNVGDLPPSQYIEARRYLNQLDDAIRALEDPRATNFFNNTWTAKGKNVAELVDHMKSNGLRFAPAAPGDEGAYSALYQALRNFEAGMQVAAKERPSSEP